MPLTQQTWIFPTNPTAAIPALTTGKMLTALKNALDAWTAGHWEVDQYDANNYLTIKRKGSPGGVLGTFRGIVFGRYAVQSPSQPDNAALAGNGGTHVNNATDTLYCGVGEDIDTSTVVDPTTGNPFPGTKYTGGIICGTDFSTQSSYNVFLCSCDRMLAIFFYNDFKISWCLLGEIVERASDGAGIWGVIGCDAQNPNCDFKMNDTSLVPMLSNAEVNGAYYDIGAVRRLERTNGVDSINRSPLFSGATGAGMLMPIIMSDSEIADSTYRHMVGALRQVKMGPYDIGRKVIKDNTDTIIAIFMNAGASTVGSGLYLDQNL
jgi:hypothetical protein